MVLMMAHIEQFKESCDAAVAAVGELLLGLDLVERRSACRLAEKQLQGAQEDLEMLLALDGYLETSYPPPPITHSATPNKCILNFANNRCQMAARH